MKIKNYDEFHPNNTDIWATLIKNRQPQFKIHQNRGHAILALKNSASRTSSSSYKQIAKDTKLFRSTGIGWVEIDFKRKYQKANEDLLEGFDTKDILCQSNTTPVDTIKKAEDIFKGLEIDSDLCNTVGEMADIYGGLEGEDRNECVQVLKHLRYYVLMCVKLINMEIK